MTRPSAVLARLEDLALETATVIRRRPHGLIEAALMLGIVAEMWIGIVRSAALYSPGW